MKIVTIPSDSLMDGDKIIAERTRSDQNEAIARRFSFDSDEVPSGWEVSPSVLEDYVVFVVDDERVISETLSVILRQAGFKAFPFSCAKHAIAACQICTPDLLISDVLMPEMTGIELAIYFKNIHSQCKIILFSAQAETIDLLRQARDDGHHFDLVSKPVHPSYLLEKCDTERRWKSQRHATS
jgi:FixJ family two-component response regulator